MKDTVGISGHVKLEFTRKNGDVDVFEYENDVTDAFYEKVTDALVTNTDFAMDDLMEDSDEGGKMSAASHKDGIALTPGADYYATDCTDHAGVGITENADNIVVKGWTDKEATFAGMVLGRNLNDSGVGTPTFSFKTITHTIGSGDSLLITWTFNIG